MAEIKCDGCDFLEPRKLRCRKLASLPSVGICLNRPHPDFCPRAQTPMLEALLVGDKLWDIWAPTPVQMSEMKKVHALLKEEHEYVCEHEPEDQFHACVLLGALNLVEGLLG